MRQTLTLTTPTVGSSSPTSDGWWRGNILRCYGLGNKWTWATSWPIHWLGSTSSKWLADSTETTERSRIDVAVDASGFPLLSVLILSSSECYHPKVLVTIITITNISVNILARRLDGNIRVYAEGRVSQSKEGFCWSMRLLYVAAHYSLLLQDRFNLQLKTCSALEN